MAGQLVQHYLDESLAPDNKVVCCNGQKSITYGQLKKESNRLSVLLGEVGVRRSDRVLLFIRRSTDFLTGILGVLKADAVYVPIDPKSPSERWQHIVSDCRPSALLCDAQAANSLGDFFKNQIPIIHFGPDKVEPFIVVGVKPPIKGLSSDFERKPRYNNNSDDVAYILYTSGSTGKPKGVMISHRNIRNYIDWAVEYFSIQEEDRILGTAPFHFDMSTFDLWCPLKAGGTLCLASEAQMLFPEKLIQHMEDQKVTIWKGISSLLFYLERAGVLHPSRIPLLDRVLFGGDSLPARTLIRWMEVFPDKKFFNVYGPTEATGISFCYSVRKAPDSPGARIPIGRPCKGMKAVLLDPQQEPVPPGEVGELCLAGPGLGAGYLNDSERTLHSFFKAQFNGEPTDTWYRTGDLAFQDNDGNYVFMGREDNQVKIMGYRIELGEIEQAILAIEGVRDAVVVSVHRDGLDELVAFVEESKSLNLPQMLSRLRDRLPSYMIPRRLLKIDEIPRCVRGKINRPALRTIAMESSNVDG